MLLSSIPAIPSGSATYAGVIFASSTHVSTQANPEALTEVAIHTFGVLFWPPRIVQAQLDELRETHERLQLDSAAEIRKLRREAREAIKTAHAEAAAAEEAADQVYTALFLCFVFCFVIITIVPFQLSHYDGRF